MLADGRCDLCRSFPPCTCGKYGEKVHERRSKSKIEFECKCGEIVKFYRYPDYEEHINKSCECGRTVRFSLNFKLT